MSKQKSLSIIVPALNEESNLREAVSGMAEKCQESAIDWEIVLVDDGSTDRTAQLAEELSKNYSGHIVVLHHQSPQGIGKSIRDGVIASTKDALTWLPGDGENDPGEVIKYLPLLEYVDMVVPFVLNKDVRSRSRQFLSKVFLGIINFSFGTTFNYTNGNVIYKRRVFDKVKQNSRGFLFQTECLIKASRLGFTFIEVPIRIRGRLKGSSKAISLSSLKVLLYEYLRLLFHIRILRRA